MRLWIILSIFTLTFDLNYSVITCPYNTFLCDGKCISSNQRCNSTKNCKDNSNETLCGNDCPSNFFTCSNKACVPKNWVCDGENDCGDLSDEDECAQIKGRNNTCSEDKFQCPDSNLCIPNTWRCDGELDCHDGSDEDESCLQNQELPVVCFGIQCNNSNKCISKAWICDGYNDCGDGTDELNCNESKPKNIKGMWQCSNNYFACTDGSACILPSQVCDKVINCNDQSDENENCGTNKCNETNCSQLCIETPLNATCYCDKGYTLDKNDNKTCVDIDECESDNLCSQICTNIPGSYNCSCAPAYEQNGTQCNAKGPEPILIYSTNSTIRSIRLRSRIYDAVLENLTHIVGLASDYREKRIYFCDVSYSEEAILSVTFNGGDVKTQIKAGLQVSEDIAIDWLSRNLYFTDSGAKHIAACSMLKDNCHIIVKEKMYSPRAIELDVINRHVFWTDWGDKSYIGRSWLDGSYVEMFVSTSIQWPNGLAIDHIAGLLYWCDARLQRIESIGLNGQNRRVVFDDIIRHPFFMAVFENTLFWTDWHRHTVEACDKKTGKNHVTLVKEINKVPMAVHIIHPLQQMPSNGKVISEDGHPCQYNRCSHQCLLRTRTTSVCVCPAGFYLGRNNLTCQENETETFILFAYGDKIAKFHPQAIGRNILKELKPQTQLLDITAITSDGKNRVVYIADSRKKAILSLDLNTMETKTLVSKHISFIRDMALDELGNNLYWIDTAHKTVEVLSLRTNKRMILITLSQYPAAISLVFKFGLLFVAQRGTESCIEKMNMDGTERSILAKVPESFPASLAADVYSKRLFWTDPISGRINYVTFKGKKTYRVTVRDRVGRPASLIRYNNRLYWTDEESPNIFWTPNIHGRDNFAIPFFYQHNSAFVPKLNLLNSGKEETLDIREINECASNPCSHICLLTAKNFSCACATNFVLQPDGTCIEPTVCFGNHVQCLDKSACVPPAWICDGDTDCEDKSDEINCTKTCSESKFKCEDSTECIPNYWLCDGQNDCGDASDESSTICDNITCNAAEFKCNSGQCIFQVHVCDGDRDCHDNSDEERCQDNTCSTDQFRCSGGKCIDKNWVCDDEIDCPNRDDEDRNTCGRVLQCDLDEFTCNNSICIPITSKCDGRDDCGDNSDENLCTVIISTSCPHGMFRCNYNSKCIPTKSKCDGVKDCPDNEDELDCSKTCPSSFFRCKNQLCISNSWVCDGEEDCSDGEDEDQVVCHKSVLTSVAVTCAQDYFRCDSGHCIPLYLVCNEYPDCPDNSDEGIQCVIGCMSRNGECEQKCISRPTGIQCSCYDGYRLSDDNRTCLDIDECESHKCSQKCTNTLGSFLCSCVDGYRLRSDGFSCKARGVNPKLLIAYRTRIVALSIDHRHLFRVVEVKNTTIQGVDFDLRRGYIYLSTTIGIFRSTAMPNTEKKVELVVSTSRHYGKIAVDWINQNMYYVEMENSINILPLNSSQIVWTRIVKSHHKKISSIVLDPNDKHLFWSVESNTLADEGRIYRSWLDGNAKKSVAEHKLVKPNNLALDFVTKRIYWTDSHLDHIESSTYDGHDRRYVMHSGARPISLTLYEDHIYWSAIGNGESYLLLRCNKTECKNYKIVQKNIGFIADSKIFQNVTQPINAENICQPNYCSHICVPSYRSYSCLCPTSTSFDTNSSSECVMPPTVAPYSGLVTNCSLKCDNGGECLIVNNILTCRCPSEFTGTTCDTKITILPDSSTSNASTIAAIVSIVVIIFLVFLGGYFYVKKYKPDLTFEDVCRALRHNRIMDRLLVVKFTQPRSWSFHRSRNDESDKAAILSRDYSNPAFQPAAPDEEEKDISTDHSKVRLSLCIGEEDSFLTELDDRQQLISSSRGLGKDVNV